MFLKKVKLRLFLLPPREKNIPFNEIKQKLKEDIYMKELFTKFMESENGFVGFIVIATLATLAIVILG